MKEPLVILLNSEDDETYNIANEPEPIKMINLAELIQAVSGNQRKVFAAKDNKPQLNIKIC